VCNGQVLSIAQNTALFSLLGTTYGGNGQTTFALPDLRSRAPIHVGQGSGLSSYDLGQRSGTESVTLGANEMPAHSHGLNATTAGGDQLTPTANLIAPDALGETAPFKTGASGPNTALASSAVGQAGGDQPHANVQPYLVVNFYIALQGIFPSRN
jgi:microcystin-dependent protein